MCSRVCRVCRVSALSLVFVCVVAASASVEDKRAEIAPAPFVLGSRYGRSSAPLRVMAPRNDRKNDEEAFLEDLDEE